MDHKQRAAAVEAFRNAVTKAGSQSEFERQTGARQQSVSNWLKAGKLLPAEFVIATERAFDVPRHILRPDLYPCEQGIADVTGAVACNATAQSHRSEAA